MRMIACGSAHYWARKIEQVGHTVRRMSPQFVIPHPKGNKNEPNDAEEIRETVTGHRCASYGQERRARGSAGSIEYASH